MQLRDKLAAMREKSESRIPPETVAIMHRATDDLLHSGIMDRALKTGGTAPLFTLPDEREQPVSTSEILAKGPLVLHFYRGMW